MTIENDKNRATSFEGMGRRVDEEVERLIRYLNDEVVPQIRNRSSRSLRVAAEKLSRLADYMEERTAGKASSSSDDRDQGMGI